MSLFRELRLRHAAREFAYHRGRRGSKHSPPPWSKSLNVASLWRAIVSPGARGVAD